MFSFYNAASFDPRAGLPCGHFASTASSAAAPAASDSAAADCRDWELQADVVVVGSGSGGGVLASELVQRGYDVLLLEKVRERERERERDRVCE